jgi:hypothetical protein
MHGGTLRSEVGVVVERRHVVVGCVVDVVLVIDCRDGVKLVLKPRKCDRSFGVLGSFGLQLLIESTIRGYMKSNQPT